MTKVYPPQKAYGK